MLIILKRSAGRTAGNIVELYRNCVILVVKIVNTWLLCEVANILTDCFAAMKIFNGSG